MRIVTGMPFMPSTTRAVGLELLVLVGQVAARGSGTGTRCGTGRRPRAGLRRASRRPRAARCWPAARSRCRRASTAGVWRRRLSLPRSSSPWRCLKPVLGQHDRRRDRRSPRRASPSTMTSRPRGSAAARCARRPPPGCPGCARRSRCARCAPPTSVTKPANTVLLELDHVGRRQVVRDSTSGIERRRPGRCGSRAAPRRRRRRLPRPSCAAARARPPARRRPCARAGTRPRSRRTARPARPSAASAPTRRCSAARGSVLARRLVSASSSSSIRCTSRGPQLVRRVFGAASAPSSLQLARSSSTTRVAAGAHAVDLGVDPLGLDEVVRDLEPAATRPARARPMAMPPDDAAGRAATKVMATRLHRSAHSPSPNLSAIKRQRPRPWPRCLVARRRSRARPSSPCPAASIITPMMLLALTRRSLRASRPRMESCRRAG